MILIVDLYELKNQFTIKILAFYQDYVKNLLDSLYSEKQKQSISVGELKARFSEVLEQVGKGKEIIISYGKKYKYDHYTPK
jgi:hypothetical protein